jgi:FKBP-type peptidyl-prolyl cis-trans isomerase (trigger factor)
MDNILKDPSSKKEWEQMKEEEKKKAEASILQEARNALFLYYLSKKIARDANLEISLKETQDEAVAILKSSGIKNPDKEKIPENIMALSFSRILLAKAQDHILKQAEKS